MMMDDQAIIVTGDGDFHCLVAHFHIRKSSLEERSVVLQQFSCPHVADVELGGRGELGAGIVLSPLPR
jgi:hypothetical protein